MTQDRKRDEKVLSEKLEPEHNDRRENRTTLDLFVDQQFVDDVPVADMVIKREKDMDRHRLANESKNKKSYEADFGDENR